MAFKTIEQLAQAVIQELSLVTGTGVQVYTEPLVYHQIENAAKHYFKMRFWDHLTEVTTYTLDGVAGVVDETIVPIDDAVDINWIKVYPFRDCDELPFRKSGDFIIGERGWSMFSFNHPQRINKGFFVYPLESAGQIKVRTRRMLTDFTDKTSIVPFDDIMVQHFVASMMLAADGMNATMQQMQMALAEDRFSNLVASEGDKPIYGKDTFRKVASSFTVAP